MDNRTEIWMPLGLNPGNRQNRGKPLPLSHRSFKRRSDAAGGAEPSSTRSFGTGASAPERRIICSFRSRKQGGHILQMEPMRDEVLGEAGQAIWVLQVAVGFVLLIACANLANLLLARAEARHREFAVRTALGAGRGRLLRQFMTEGVLLSLAGGAFGLLLARLGVRALVDAYPASLPRTSEVAVDPRVLLFTFGVSIATGLIFGLAPLMHIRMKRMVTALKEGGARGATRSARHHIRRGLVMAEVAIAVMLVIGAGLLLRTVYNLTTIRRGVRSFAPRNLLDDAAQRQLPAARGPRAGISKAPREASRRAGCSGCDSHVGAAAEPSAQRQRHRHRWLQGSAGGAVRKRRLLPERHVRLFRDDGHSDRAGAQLSAGRHCLDGHGGGRQRNTRQHVLEGPQSDRPASATLLRRAGAMVHRHWRGEGRQAGRRRSENGNRVLFLRRPDVAQSRRRSRSRPER